MTPDLAQHVASLVAAFLAGALVMAGIMRQREAGRVKALRSAELTRQQLEAFFEHAPVGLAIHDTKGNYVYASSVTQQMYGMSDAELKGRSMQSISHIWPDAEEIEQVMLEVAQGEVRRLLKPLHSPGEAEPFYFDVIMFPIRDAAGEVVQIGALGSDVTALKQAEAAAVQREAQLLSLFEHVPADISIYDTKHNIVMVDRSTAAHYGKEPEEFVGLYPSEFSNHWDNWDHILQTGIEVLETGVANRFRTTFHPPATGGTIIYDAMFFPIRSEVGEIKQVGLFLVDVTKQVETERALEAQREQGHQSEKLAALGQLLAGVAHELNNPLTVVVGRSAILAEKLADTPHSRALNDIREAADRCGRIVKTFLAMARQSAPRRGAVQINDTIEAALDMVAYNLRSGGVDLVRAYDPDLPEVDADEDQLVQVFTNLMINAGHALEGADEPRRLTLTTRVENGHVVAEFADTGPGVAADLVTRIFEPFFTTKGVGEGTGMGLAMARGAVEEFGGTLDYTDGAEGGAVFLVTLPIPALSDQAPHIAAPAAEPVSPATTPAGARVLIVDDEPAIRTMLAEILRRIGIDSAECGDGAEAVARLESESFDLIVCDVRMPVMDGVRFRQHLADHRPELLERLVFMSGDVLQRSGERYAPLSAHAIIDKPFRPSEARAVVTSALARLAQRSEPA